MKKVALFTSGGDAPGMNACIRAVVRTGIYHEKEVYGIYRGYEGMIEGDIRLLESRDMANIIQRGGTMLKTSRSQLFTTHEGRKQAYEQLKKLGIEGLICIGGNGTFTGAKVFEEEFGIPSIGIPGTIDNDLYGTDYTIGYDTAINTALDAIDKIRDTADSHDRTFFVEVMGRDAGFIAIDVGIGAGAEAILVPESHGSDWAQLDRVFSSEKRRKSFSIIVVAEGDEEGGAFEVARKVKARYPQIDPRVTVLGHIQRGGSPTAFDRYLATLLGNFAMESLLQGHTAKMAGIVNRQPVLVGFDDAINKRKNIDPALLQMIEVLNV